MQNNMPTEVKLCKTCVRNINSKYIPSSNGECEYCQKFRQYEKNIRERLEKMKDSYPKDSTTCYLNLLQVILSRKFFGYTHYDCEESTLIDFTEKTKKEAIQTNNMNISIDKINEVLKKLRLKSEDIGLTKADIKKFSKFYF